MNSTRIFDRVHGDVVLSEDVARIASTQTFSRLDLIRQLGGCAFVYPSASHTRREHSIGVSHLAGAMGRHFMRQHPELVDATDLRCLEIAGLLHDLGHGPFSHLFEEYVHETDAAWSHEEMTLRVMEHMLRQMSDPLERRDVDFIRLMIVGLDDHEAWPLASRPEAKRFLLDIVHNRTSGIDVDKLDYLMRDAVAVLGATHSVDAMRIIGAARLVHDEARERHVLAYDERVALSVAQVYALRARLHKQVYQHRAVLVVEGLLKDLIRLHDQDATEDRFIDRAYNVEEYVRFTDASVLNRAYGGRALEAWRRLYVRPWMARIPLSVRLRTRPCCRACAHETSIADAFCSECGSSTRDRAGRSQAENGALDAEESFLSDAEATRILTVRAQCSGVRVHISDVHCGAPIVVIDPHGRRWRDYDPLSTVVFCNRDATETRRVRSDSVDLPLVRRVRVAHCYVPNDTSEASASVVEGHFRAWGTDAGVVSEL